MHPYRSLVLCLALVALSMSPSSARLAPAPGSPDLAGHDASNVTPKLTRAPVRFECNEGQTDGQARFLVRSRQGMAFLTSDGLVLTPLPPEGAADAGSSSRPAAVRMTFDEANRAVRATGLDPLPGVTNYLIGNDPAKWRRNVRGYGKVRYESIYPGVDLVYYGDAEGHIEYDFVVAPGADPGQIQLSIDGADDIRLDASGDLVMQTAAGDVIQKAPHIYQEVDGVRREIAGSFAMIESGTVGFDLDDYDASIPLVIDPVVVYATLLGGETGVVDGGYDLTVDAEGNAYVAGLAQSSDFPTRDALQGSLRGLSDAFVAKFAPDGALIFSTFFGGGFDERASAIAVDATGAIYLAGNTTSNDLPLEGAFQTSRAEFSGEGFVTKLAPDGASIVYSSYLGGSENEDVVEILVDSAGALYVAGNVDAPGTMNATFPTVNSVQATYGGGESDGFLCKVSATGGSLLISTLLGGNGEDRIRSMTLDQNVDGAAGRGLPDFVCLGMETNSDTVLDQEVPPPDVDQMSCERLQQLLPILSAPSQGALGIVAVELLNSPELSCVERVRKLENYLSIYGTEAVPPRGSRGSAGGGFDVFLLGPAGASGQYRIRAAFGGSRSEFANAAVSDARGAVYVTGDTNSLDLPTIGPVQAEFGGRTDAFVVAFAPGSLAPAFATYYGGIGDEIPTSIAVDPQGNIYITGFATLSPDFPTSPGAFQQEFKGRNNAFLVKISPVDFTPDFALSADPSVLTATRRQKGQITIDVERMGGFDGRVTVTAPNTKAIKVKLTPGSESTTGTSVTFNYKVKKKAQPGTHQLVFTGRDAEGRERTAALTLAIE